ncbi:SPFH domain-containing protein [Neisseria leonii]|uniref:SPFH domain-containing protein n=1 Tax=Neisseria leonii TaxID=2995413 RepID=UPI00237A2165|nr:stomatin-like protein [Neisseria sp. 3986]MDD9325591.1 paraslipin [Neisseria sp. 3986]
MDFTAFINLPLFILIAVIIFGFKAVCIVPQQEAYIVERFGKFHNVLTPGLKFVVPIMDRVAYRHTLKEIPLDVPSQVCITRDNTQLTVDGIIYFQVTDPKLASYGTSNYITAITQLAQTTLRSVIGRMELDKTFEEREEINRVVVDALDDAAVSWGVKVLRYEIKDLIPPQEILRAMQAQITAEREKRARIAESEGRKIEQINLASGQREAEIQQSEGEAQAAINASNGDKVAKINQAQGEAEALRLVAGASADAIRMVAEAIRAPGGEEAVKLKVAEQYVEAFAKLAKENNTLIMPANVADIGSLVAAGMKIAEGGKTSR